MQEGSWQLNDITHHLKVAIEHQAKVDEAIAAAAKVRGDDLSDLREFVAWFMFEHGDIPLRPPHVRNFFDS
jgi:hypothetical protein